MAIYTPTPATGTAATGGGHCRMVTTRASPNTTPAPNPSPNP